MWLDQAVEWLLPREEHFFDLLERGARSALKSSAILVKCCKATTADERAEIVARITDEEHVGDKVIHEVYAALNRTFVTPMDRSDIYKLATDLENITDCVHSTVMQISVHAIEEFPDGSLDLAEKMHLACVEIDAAVKLLRGMKKLDVIRTHCGSRSWSTTGTRSSERPSPRCSRARKTRSGSSRTRSSSRASSGRSTPVTTWATRSRRWSSRTGRASCTGSS